MTSPVSRRGLLIASGTTAAALAVGAPSTATARTTSGGPIVDPGAILLRDEFGPGRGLAVIPEALPGVTRRFRTFQGIADEASLSRHPPIPQAVPAPPLGLRVFLMPHAIASDGTRIAYQVEGEGHPLVLLAGQSNSHHWWDPVRGDFGAGYRTITVDYRGTGDSDKPDQPYSTEGFADDVIAVLDQLEIEVAAVYGTSMGGRVAQWMAIRYPGRVGSLVLGCTSPGKRHGFERGNDVRKALAQPDRAAVQRVLLELMYTPGWLAHHSGPYATLGDPTMPAYAKGRHLVASNSHDSWDALPAITAPTLVLHGTDDIFSPVANASLLKDRIPGARLHLIPGARHAYFEEFRTTASAYVLDFLAEHTTSESGCPPTAGSRAREPGPYWSE